jgi:hypothetical protein
MGFFGLFGKRKSALQKHAERVANKRAQAPDRWESIQELGKIATTDPSGGVDERADAVAALMERFTYYADPTITDAEEKDEAFRWVCEAGEIAIEPVRASLKRHESMSWGLKCLARLVDPTRMIEEMLALLSEMDTEYERDPQRKIQLLGSLEEERHRAIAEAVAPFFLDVNESARFHAVGAALAQDNAEEILPLLREALVEDDSVRVKVRALDAIIQKGWSLGEQASSVELPDGYELNPKGVPRKKK